METVEVGTQSNSNYPVELPMSYAYGCHPKLLGNKAAVKNIAEEAKKLIIEGSSLLSTIGYDVFVNSYKISGTNSKEFDSEFSSANSLEGQVTQDYYRAQCEHFINDNNAIRAHYSSRQTKISQDYAANHKKHFGDEPCGTPSVDEVDKVLKITKADNCRNLGDIMRMFRDLNDKGVDVKDTMRMALTEYYKESHYEPAISFGSKQQNSTLRSLQSISFNVKGALSKKAKHRSTPRLISKYLFGKKDKRSDNGFRKKSSEYLS